MVRSTASSENGEDDSYLADSVFTLSSWARGRETDTEIDGFSQAGETLCSSSSFEEGDQLAAFQVDSVGSRQLSELCDENLHASGGGVNRKLPLYTELDSGYRNGNALGTELDGDVLKASCIEGSSCAAPLAWAQPVPNQLEEPPVQHGTKQTPYRNTASSYTLCTSMTNSISGSNVYSAIDPRKAALSVSGTATSDSSNTIMQMRLDRGTTPTALPRIKCVLLLVTAFVVVLVVFLAVGVTWYRQTDQFDRWESRPTIAPIPFFIASGPTDTHIDTGSEQWTGSAITSSPTKGPTVSSIPAVATEHPTPKTAQPSLHRKQVPTVSPTRSIPETTPYPTVSPSWGSREVGPTLRPTALVVTKPSSPPNSLTPTVSPSWRSREVGPTLRPTVLFQTKPSSPPNSFTSASQGPIGLSIAKPSLPPTPTELPRTYTISPSRPTTPIETTTKAPTSSVANPASALDSRAENLLAVLQSVSLLPIHHHYPNNGDSPGELALSWLVEQDPAQLNGLNVVRVQQRYALASLWFHTATQSSTWIEAGGWITGAHECLWYGVTCENGHIHTIRMASNGMSGRIPDSLGLLTGLRMLYLQGNALSGTIPTGLALCTDLLALQLSNNDLSGSIPASLSRLNSVRYVQLKSNKLSSSLSPTLSGWKDLEILSLGQNDLSGTIPSEFGAWTNLTRLRLNNNHFAGSIPSLPQWSNLVEFNVQHNDFAGSLPATIGIQWLDMEILHVGENKGLTGLLPVSYSNWMNLIAFSAPKTALTGTLPVQYAKWINIKSFDVSDNRLGGTLPRVYGVWQKLVHFRVSDNNLTGPIPGSFSSWDRLEEFAVARNQLAGTLATGFGAWTKLKALKASDNKLNGMIPETASSWTELTHFDVSRNSMTGILPPGVVFWTNIKAALFQGNQIGGLVPFCVFGFDVETLIADCDKSTCICCTECCRSTEVGSVCKQVP